MTALRLGVNTLFYLPGEVGGTETYLLETLRALVRRPDRPDLVLFSNVENEGKLRGEFPEAEVVAAGIGATNRFVRILAEQFQLPRLVKRSGVDVLWSPGYTAPFRCACPQVATMHDMQYKRFPADVTWLAARTMDVLYPGVARHCSALVAPTEFAKREIVAFTGAPADRVFVTLEGVDPLFRKKQPVPDGVPPGPFLLCVAHTYPHKNTALLVRAFNRVAAAIPHRLVLVGKARLGEAEVASAVQESPAGRVVRLPGLPWLELIGLYQAADWFVFPSLYEGFGLPVLESMCAGVPVLTTREASIPEIGGETVLYADGRDESAFAQALLAAVNLPRAERLRLVESAKQRAAAFTWEASAEKLWQVLVGAAAARGTGRPA